MGDKNVLATLFDFSFDDFITIHIVQILYIIGMVLAGLFSIFLIFSGFTSGGFLPGIIMLILSPLIFLIYVVFFRVWLEIVLVLFRIAENTNEMVDKLSK